jgi:hypothetical protein
MKRILFLAVSLVFFISSCGYAGSMLPSTIVPMQPQPVPTAPTPLTLIDYFIQEVGYPLTTSDLHFNDSVGVYWYFDGQDYFYYPASVQASYTLQLLLASCRMQVLQSEHVYNGLTLCKADILVDPSTPRRFACDYGQPFLDENNNQICAISASDLNQTNIDNTSRQEVILPLHIYSSTPPTSWTPWPQTR